MEPTDLTLQILREIRDELKSSNARHDARFEQVNTRLDDMRAESNARFEQAAAESNSRFEVIETALRDAAQQLVMLSRGIKTALETRSEVDRRLSDVEHRLDALEKPQH